MPPLSDQDYAALKADIAAHGVKSPVDYDEAGNILDGHHRVAICRELGLNDWPRFVRKGLSEEAKRDFALSINLLRRHLSLAQRRAIAAAELRAKPESSARAIAEKVGVDHKTVGAIRKEMESTGEIPQSKTVVGRNGVRKPAVQPIRTMYLPEKANVREVKAVAKAIRTAEMATSRTIKKGLIRAIAEKGEIRAGHLPRAAFPVGYADPPWEQQAWSDETGQDRGLPYPPMPLDAIKGLCAGEASPFTRDAVLFLWVTTSRLADGIDVLRAWGFAYVSAITWDKELIGLGRWVRDRTEHLLIGKRGNFPGLTEGTQPASLFAERRQGHSRKPEAIARMIDRLFPDLPKIELFQRAESLALDDVRRGDGWHLWGFEAGETAP
ncbi:hypothetical protein BJF92_11215 [Rhizobium rhizosphaerae]|uniref:S-adenosylmethionine-binding protein n=2 Tax=Xaviernesmea rhizosphaerae TaxID=1672749 RepID=A0A1Q9ANP8_9HYPH|nr:hypothetical protein BJF92_11215 [Xaviernesmea rhizosphaerae]